MPQPSVERGRYGEDGDVWKARYERTVDQYTSHLIGRDTFAASLYDLGFRGQDIEAEIALNPPKPRAEDLL